MADLSAAFSVARFTGLGFCNAPFPAAHAAGYGLPRAPRVEPHHISVFSSTTFRLNHPGRGNWRNSSTRSPRRTPVFDSRKRLQPWGFGGRSLKPA